MYLPPYKPRILVAFPIELNLFDAPFLGSGQDVRRGVGRYYDVVESFTPIFNVNQLRLTCYKCYV